MSTWVVYESMWGNSRAVAEAITAGTGGVAVEVTSAPEVVPDEVELLVVGGPTHAFSMSRATTRSDAKEKGAPNGGAPRGIREWLHDVGTPHAVEVATFDTRVASVRHLPGSAAKAAAKEVRRRRLGRLVATQSFYVDDMAGPLLDGELERAREWGQTLVARPVHR